VTRNLAARAARVLVPLAALVAVAVSGCSSQWGAAAVVGDRRITVNQVQEATADIQQVLGPDAQLTQSQVLYWLVLAPYVLDAAARHGIGVSVDDARREMQAVKNPSAAGLLAVRSAMAMGKLQGDLEAPEAQKAYEEVRSEVDATKIRVNPRFGVFDPKQFIITPKQPDWLPATPTPAPTLQPGATGQPAQP